MLAIQPPLLPVFFVAKRQVNQEVAQAFFLSWEDALWHVLQIYALPVGTVILVPSFFCGNVVEHMQAHGLRIVYYRLTSSLVADEQDFINQLRHYKPQLVVIFHPIGITSNLLKNPSNWRSFFPEKSILIEDCVHRVIDVSELNKNYFLHKRHLLIDSLRKVVPIQGSCLYSLEEITKPSWQHYLVTLPYQIVVLFWWLLMQICLLVAHYSPWKRVELVANLLAEQAMLSGYAVIGRNYMAAPGFIFLRNFVASLNHYATTQTKIRQYLHYDQVLRALLISVRGVVVPAVPEDDHGRLRAYPIVITDLSLAAAFLHHCRQNGIVLRYELNDSPWSVLQKVFYLPMGLHVSSQAVERVIVVVTQFFSKS